MRLVYLHGSTLEALWATGKVRFLDAFNPDGVFGEVEMVNLDPASAQEVVRVKAPFRFRSIGLARRGSGLLSKVRSLRDSVDSLCAGPRPDLILADDANLLGFAARWAASRLGIPYALCIYYDNDLHHRLSGKPALAFLRSRRLECALERWVLRGAVGVYAGNRGYRDYALRHGAEPDRTYLGSWSVDEIFYGEPPTPHPDSREILFVGRLHPLKFIDDVLAALCRLPPALRLDVAGEGPDRSRLEALAGSLGLEHRVRFLGIVPREELWSRMQGALALVVSQGFNAVVEALLSARPVVAYDYECNAEVVRDGDTGLLVPFRDVAALARAIERVVQDGVLAAELGGRGRERMLEECALRPSIEHRRRFLERCLAR